MEARNFFATPSFDSTLLRATGNESAGGGSNFESHDNMKIKARAAFTMIEIMVVVAIIGVIAAIAIPSFKSAITKSQKQACAINRKNIDGAKAAWAVEHRMPPDTVPTDADLFGEGIYIDHKPDCPAGGAYALNAVREKCTCNVPVHGN